MSRQSSTAILFSVIVSIGLVVVAGCVPPQEVAVIDAEAKQEEEAQQAQLQKINAAVSAAVNEVKNSIDYCRGKVTVELKDIIRVDQTRANVNAKFVAEMMALGKQYGGKTATVGNGLHLTFDDLGQRDYKKVKDAIQKKATDATPQVMLAGKPTLLECKQVEASAKWASLSGGASVENEPKESVDLTFRLSGLLDGTSFWLVPKSNSFLVNLEQQTGASANDIFRVRHEPNNGTWAKTIRGKVTKFDPSDVYVMIARDVKIGKGKFKVVEYRVFNVRLPRGTPEDQQIKLGNALAQPACPPVAIDSASVNYFKGQLGSCK
jgi:hypothetical protein